jgi:hypothetical protein
LRPTVKAILIIILVSAFNLSFGQRRPKDKILDRKVFVIHLKEVVKKKKKDEEPIESELSFRSNKLVSRYMQSSDGGGFQAGEYVIYDKEDILGEKRYKFEGINKNSKGVSLKWKGSVFGGQIKGTVRISKKGKVRREYTFTGALKQKIKRK